MAAPARRAGPRAAPPGRAPAPGPDRPIEPEPAPDPPPARGAGTPMDPARGAGTPTDPAREARAPTPPAEAVGAPRAARRGPGRGARRGGGLGRWAGVSLRRSPLARRIVGYNLVALALLVAGVLRLEPFRDGIVIERERALAVEARLVAAVIEARLEARAEPGRGPRPGLSGELDGEEARRRALARALGGLALPGQADLRLYDARGALVAARPAPAPPGAEGGERTPGGALGARQDAERPEGARGSEAADGAEGGPENASEAVLRAMARRALAGEAPAGILSGAGGIALHVAVPIAPGEAPAGALVLSSASGVIDDLARAEREAVLRLFALAIALSTGLGLALASTIAGPLWDLAQAAEAGRGAAAAKVRIPDLTARRDEIGRLSGALRGLVAALYERVDAEERFAADVAHEIKNPLASLGSAVSALRAARPDQRERLLAVIEHDLRRLDRLVSDILNASRLDSELVREAEAPFDLTHLLAGLAEHLGRGAALGGVALAADLPARPIVVRGLEARLAQVFVNLIDNAVSFCEPGGAVRVWARRQGARVLVAVEDTGPGIPEAALGQIFERFYSERPEGEFGDHSGLGLAISRQIVEAHGGVIWAENIPAAARPGPGAPAAPAGARLVVALPA